jgi:hypothetical protein
MGQQVLLELPDLLAQKVHRVSKVSRGRRESRASFRLGYI